MVESFPMNGGDGTYSYTKNSQFQKQASDSVKGMIEDAILEKLDTKALLSISNSFRIVDLGCSVGPNTFYIVQNMIETVKKKCSLQGLDSENIEFEVYFNDHPGNDFNTLFASLPPDHEQSYYAAGVPGSFYGRLFPHDSISVAHSSYALQWLSKVPDGVSDTNEGRIHYTGSSRQVVDAYAEQFERDMGVFISARAQEIFGGGLLILTMPGIYEADCHTQGVLFNFLGSILMDMANEEIFDKAKVDAFNLPIYAPTIAEMRKVVENNGCFSIERIELSDMTSQAVKSLNVHSLIMHLRAGMEGIFTQHFGNVVVEKLFDMSLAKADELSRSLESGEHNSAQLFVVLKRK